jgi:GTP pyrophosphokinase
VKVDWESTESRRFQTGLTIQSLDRVGLLNDISAVFSETKTNICSAKVSSHPDKTATFDLIVEIDNLEHLNNLITRISGLSDILEVRRTNTLKDKS